MTPLISVGYVVDSSNIASIGYDHASKKLGIQFQAGNRRYLYEDVPEDVFVRLMNSPSKGEAFNSQIRQFYKGVRLEGGAGIFGRVVPWKGSFSASIPAFNRKTSIDEDSAPYSW